MYFCECMFMCVCPSPTYTLPLATCFFAMQNLSTLVHMLTFGLGVITSFEQERE